MIQTVILENEKARHMARYSLDVADSACKPDKNYGIVTYDGWFKSVYRDDNAKEIVGYVDCTTGDIVFVYNQ